jgi:SAM-dependent methyltransferase
MTEELDEQIARSLDATPELLPFLPELLADVWALGSSVEIIVDLLRQMEINDPGRRVFDVGCGKGAVAVSVAKENGCCVYGIDGFEPFIAEARERATVAGVAELCTFECGDMREAVAQVRDYDAVIYAAHSPVLIGRPCVEVLRECVRQGGYILVDDGFLADGVQSKPPGYEDFLPYDGTVAALTDRGDRVVREVIQSPATWHADDDRITDLVRRRAEDLAVRHPQAASLLNEYVRVQERECETLRAIHVPATWLLKRS